ncbi:MAG: DUF937 domain-containing protein [Candidatus Competibacteraceae bacterium]|nr:DUF937 domain-containing protein [Candidatus Competibacteraceae bacterium]
MNLLDTIMNSQGSPVGQIARQFGLDERTVGNVMQQFLPALTNGVKKNVQQDGGLDSLLGALNRGGHERYLDDSASITQPGAVQDGNNILGHLFGDKQVSRELAARTSQQTGVDSSILKQMLPMVAGLAMGALNKQTHAMGMTGGGMTGGGLTGGAQSSSSLGPLMGLLDADGDGSVVDDLMGLAGRFLR